MEGRNHQETNKSSWKKYIYEQLKTHMHTLTKID